MTTAMSLLRRPSAYVPLLCSLGALSIVLGYLVLYGAARQEDEGTAAHLFQLLMVLQVPVVAFFAFTWLPRAPRAAVTVLALQAVAGIAALTPLYLAGL
ncbi:MAG: hypothetical protein AB7O67_08375 [Vicinamibacterales bacterium]